MSLRGVDSIKALKQGLRALPLSVAHSVAQRSAPAMTGLTRQAYASGRSVYGDPRPSGVDGKPLTLHKTGAAEEALSFVASGTVIRSRLGPNYVRYLIGKYGVLPNGPLPVSFTDAIARIASETKVDL